MATRHETIAALLLNLSSPAHQLISIVSKRRLCMHHWTWPFRCNAFRTDLDLPCTPLFFSISIRRTVTHSIRVHQFTVSNNRQPLCITLSTPTKRYLWAEDPELNTKKEICRSAFRI